MAKWHDDAMDLKGGNGVTAIWYDSEMLCPTHIH